jgi:trans-2,3-dihydro-3-hydroxyanthranilate isomerase
MPLEFVTVDVFTERRFGGNPLAVVFDGQRLSTAQMQSIAGEFNLSETTFVLPPKAAAHTAEVRIFTPRAELPFAGHPNVGTAFALANRGAAFGRPIGEAVVFEERAGLVPLELWREGATTVGARLAAPQPMARGDDVAADAVAAACSIAIEDIETRHHMPCIASCGVAFVIAELKTIRALQAARPEPQTYSRHFPAEVATGIHLYTHDGGDGADIRARMFAPLYGVAEDPATGSANLILAALLTTLRPEPDLALRWRIAQGAEMGRPSRLEAAARKRGGRVVETSIGGRCVAVMTGTIDI